MQLEFRLNIAAGLAWRNPKWDCGKSQGTVKQINSSAADPRDDFLLSI